MLLKATVTKKSVICFSEASSDLVEQKLESLFNDIELLLQAKLAVPEAFFSASMIHLMFVKIHPFEDGNGRTARLFEKWFISESSVLKPGSCKRKNITMTINNIRLLGLEYELLDYSAALPFLLMLPQSL
ncbi:MULTISPECIES: Fic family protein [Mucilaginibacter]|jgi:hypothetical protein|uniref:Fic family protein n=1 Tax=Mucilaginibacter TaxID=423349 RepID=UPI0008712350|nr:MULTISPECIES: Fic family protein [Mucilaginibacter]NVM63763.1 hypothetical protein [Mucilaginibacter sp. SG538B]SCW69000.1 Fic/DOC family protein [Mucilaginibacter sp. NFR10]